MICDHQDSYGKYCIYPSEVILRTDDDVLFLCSKCWENYYSDIEEGEAVYITGNKEDL